LIRLIYRMLIEEYFIDRLSENYRMLAGAVVDLQVLNL
jgi:hypothetical protein